MQFCIVGEKRKETERERERERHRERESERGGGQWEEGDVTRGLKREALRTTAERHETEKTGIYLQQIWRLRDPDTWCGLLRTTAFSLR